MNNQRDMAVYNQRNLAYEWDWIWQVKSTVYKEPSESEPGHIETEVRIPVDKIQNKNREQIVTVIPFVVGQRSQSTPTTGTLGGDLNLSLDKHKLKATINTDESTLEADPFQFSLYGQSIFLQEKRPFLSKDLDIYRTPINILYTRAIQDIQWGGNYTFRSDDIKAGVVSVEDELDSDGDGRRERRHLTAARTTWHGGALNFGTTLLYGKNADTKVIDRGLSFDARFDLPLGLRFVPQWITNTNGSAYQVQLALPYNWGGGFYGMRSIENSAAGSISRRCR